MNLFYCFCFALIHYICLNLTFSVLKKNEFQTPVAVVVHSLSRVQLFVPPWTAACQASLFTISQSLLKLMSIESAIPSNHLFLCRPPLLLPSVFSRIRVFTDESALCIRWPKYWSFSFTISLYSEYSGLISFRIETPRDSQESSPTPQFKSINSLVLNLLYGPTLTSIHDYGKIHSFNYTNLCWQSDISAF